MNEQFAQRLQRARKLAGLSMDELVEKTGSRISKNAISKYEKGVMMPSSETLLILSNALGVSPGFFYKGGKFTIESVEFRTKGKLSKKSEERIRHKAIDLAERYFEIEELLDTLALPDIPTIKVKKLNVQILEETALTLRDRWQLGMAPIMSVFNLFEDHGIKILEIDEEANFDGMSAYVNGKYPFIIISKNATIERKRFTAVHELAHLIFKESKLTLGEGECHIFARNFLLPSADFIKRIGSSRHEILTQELIPLQEYYGISIRAMLFIARDNGVINDTHLQTFQKRFKKDEKFRSYIDLERFKGCEKTSRIQRLVYQAIAMEIITESKAAEILELSLNEIRDKLVSI